MGLVRVGDVMAGIRMGKRKRKRKKGADVVRGFGGRLAPPILYDDLMEDWHRRFYIAIWW